MNSPLGNFIRERRLAAGLDKRGKLVRKLRPAASERQLSRLGAQIFELEERGNARRELLDEIAAALGISEEDLDPFLEAENRRRREAHERYLAEWNKWADEPIRPYLILVPVPGFNVVEEIPDEAIVSLKIAEAWASDLHRRPKCGLHGRAGVVMASRVGMAYSRAYFAA